MTGRDIYNLRQDLGRITLREVAAQFRHPADGTSRSAAWLSLVETGQLQVPDEVVAAGLDAVYAADAEANRKAAQDPEYRRYGRLGFGKKHVDNP